MSSPSFSTMQADYRVHSAFTVYVDKTSYDVLKCIALAVRACSRARPHCATLAAAVSPLAIGSTGDERALGAIRFSVRG